MLVESLTGVVLFAFGHGLTPKGTPGADQIFRVLAATNLLTLQDISFQTDTHVWAGYLTCWTLAWKGIASWPTLIGWWPRRFSVGRLAFEKSMAWALLVLAPASYLSGLALTARILYRFDRPMREVHLWVSVALVVPLVWHLIRYLPTGLKVFQVQVVRMIGQLKPRR